VVWSPWSQLQRHQFVSVHASMLLTGALVLQEELRFCTLVV
jgi:hypothetical protein